MIRGAERVARSDARPRRPTCACIASALLAAGVLAAVDAGAAPAPPRFEVDHVWIMVSPAAPERSALERLGLIVAPGINQHTGQGTASVTFELTNAFIELVWVDPAARIAPGLEVGARKFVRKAAWRTSGWCPFGIALHRTPAGPDSLPFTSWPLHVEWMPPGVYYAMLTARADTLSPSVWVKPRVDTTREPGGSAAVLADSVRATAFRQPPGLRRLTRVRLIHPRPYRPTEAMRDLAGEHVFELGPGDGWLLELTFNQGAARRTRDLRPDLPVVVHY